ncbi:DUF2357 domain-containing protein [uncultured Clostridium sp.]|uniref:DUF2357 domain-containing protein n=1 Tax=uncultured Clostridium sp. TaxID=59620 RepID=UPI0025D2E933|nr:DUF2357 domain-containing protein [uncultured Clostridium sp.]
MDSQASGKNELLSFETSNLVFVLKGEKYGTNNQAEFKLDTYEEEVENLNFIQGLHLMEYSNYEIIIESKNGASLEFYHDNLNIRNKVTKVTSRSKNLSGIINFKGEMGLTDFIVKVDGIEKLKITLEVYPSKISYKEDYQNILKDVNEEIYNLAYGFLGRTYLNSEINNMRNNDDSEFYSILNYVLEKFIKAIDIVLNNPYHALTKEERIVKYHNIKNVTSETIRYLEKRPYLMKNVQGRLLPSEALVVKKTVTNNVKENRFLKFILENILRKIDRFIIKFKNSGRDVEYLEKIYGFKRDIKRRINGSLLRNIESKFTNADTSLVFTMAPGYREVYKYYLMLQKGLSINSDIFNISIKDLSLLYEYWCFIKINGLLQKKYKLDSADFFKVNNNGVNVKLRKGEQSSLTYINPKTNEKFSVIYNGKRESKTSGQYPDNILSLNKEGSSKKYEFIFDAKYKIDNSGGIKGPKEEDINTMHRYRDAIVCRDKNRYKHTIFGAFVLFPYDDEEKFKDHPFYKSIDEVNIGAFPFLPSTTSLMEEFLDELILESSYSGYERHIAHTGEEDYLKDEYFNNREVLVGTLKNKEQFEICMNYNFYHIPKGQINLSKHNVKFIALAQSKKVFEKEAGILWYGKVKSVEPVKRSDIKEIPKNSDDIYYRFEIEKWIKLPRKIEVKGYQVRRFLYTSIYLLKNAENISEICIKSKEEFRLWKELKRYNKDIKTQGKDNVVSFILEDITFIIDDENIMAVKDGMVKTESKEKFEKTPIKILKNLINFRII